MRSDVPSRTPGGILMVKVEVRSTEPRPWQVSQGEAITIPSPLQVGQVCDIMNIPRWLRICPDPPQVLQVVADVPGFAPEPPHVSQRSARSTRIGFLVPS